MKYFSISCGYRLDSGKCQNHIVRGIQEGELDIETKGVKRDSEGAETHEEA
jgi:hypothetical protein